MSTAEAKTQTLLAVQPFNWRHVIGKPFKVITDNAVISLMLSVYPWTKVITLSSVYCRSKKTNLVSSTTLYWHHVIGKPFNVITDNAFICSMLSVCPWTKVITLSVVYCRSKSTNLVISTTIYWRHVIGKQKKVLKIINSSLLPENCCWKKLTLLFVSSCY